MKKIKYRYFNFNKNFFNLIKYTAINIYYFFILKRKLSSQLEDNLKHKFNYEKKKIFIPLVETNHYQIFHILILAKSLVLRGHEVKVLICNSFLKGCEIKNFKNKDIKNPCWECKKNIKNILPLFDLDYVNYADYLSPEEKTKIFNLDKKFSKNLKSKIKFKNFDLTKTVNESLVRYYYGIKFYDNYKNIRSDHINTTLNSIIFSEKLFKKWNPDIILNNMNVYSAWEPFFLYFQNKNIRTVTISLTPLNKNAIYFNMMELLLSSKRYNNYLKKRINKKLNLHEKKQLKNFLKKRILATDDHVKINKIFEENNDETVKICEFLNSQKNKKNIFLFSNLYWDVGLSDQAGCYKDPIVWIIDTINQIKNVDSINLFIKIHPAEIAKGSESLTTIIDVIKEKITIIPKNVFFITPEKRINIYKLKKYIDLAVIFTGTLGLEMMLLGVPVINTGKVPYGDLKLSISPKNKKSYYNELKKKNNINLFFKKEVLELYAYFYFIKAPIPWNLTDKAFGNRFTGYSFKKIQSLLPNSNPQLDHLCNCIIDDSKVPEFW